MILLKSFKLLLLFLEALLLLLDQPVIEVQDVRGLSETIPIVFLVFEELFDCHTLAIDLVREDQAVLQHLVLLWDVIHLGIINVQVVLAALFLNPG